jgi:hypothetical protein
MSKRVTDEANRNRACRSRHYSLLCRGQKEMHPIYVSQDANRAAQFPYPLTRPFPIAAVLARAVSLRTVAPGVRDQERWISCCYDG